MADVLTVNGLQSGTFSGIDFSYNAALHALVFSHPAPVADFQTLMQAVQFGSTSRRIRRTSALNRPAR